MPVIAIESEFRIKIEFKSGRKQAKMSTFQSPYFLTYLLELLGTVLTVERYSW